MRLPARMGLIAIPLLAAGVLSGLALGSDSGDDASVADPPREPPRTVQEREVHGEYDATLDPPPAGVEPAISAAEAVDIALKSYTGPASAAKPTFAMYSDSAYEPFPAWVVTFEGVCFGPHSAAYNPNGPPAPVETCTNTELNVVVDAMTGERLFSYTYR